MTRFHFYATERAFQWLDSSNSSTMYDLYKITQYRNERWTYHFMNYLEIVGTFPNYIFKVEGEKIDINDYVHYVGYYDADSYRGRNDNEIVTMMEVMYGTLQRSW